MAALENVKQVVMGEKKIPPLLVPGMNSNRAKLLHSLQTVDNEIARAEKSINQVYSAYQNVQVTEIESSPSMKKSSEGVTDKFSADQILTLVEKMNHPLYGLSIKDRKYRFITYPSCFIGIECVDWLITNEKLFSRSEAVKLGQKLLDLQLIQHVARQQPFADKEFYYEFMQTTIQAYSKTVNRQSQMKKATELERHILEAQAVIRKAKEEQEKLLKVVKETF